MPEQRAVSEVLFHFTKTVDAVASILAKRFEYQFAPRRLIYDLVPDFPRDISEPQAFGAISLSETDSDRIRSESRFGRFGIAVKLTWAKQKGAQKVRYVDPDSTSFFAIRHEFQEAFDEMVTIVASKYPEDDYRKWAFWNRNAAWSLGAHRWDRALAVFEFMQHARHADEQEWRIVNRLPMEMGGEKGHAAKRAANPYGWFTNQNHVRPEDVAYLVCPPGQRSALSTAIPASFADVAIQEMD